MDTYTGEWLVYAIVTRTCHVAVATCRVCVCVCVRVCGVCVCVRAPCGLTSFDVR